MFRSFARRIGLAAGAGVLFATGLVPAATSATALAPAGTAAPVTTADACVSAAAGSARCLTKVRTDAAARRATAAANAAMAARGSRPGSAAAAALPPGFGATDLRAAYRIGASTARPTVAVVIAFDVPNAEADLAVYRSTYRLPPCTTANGCFRKVNQDGAAAPLPYPEGGWALEGSMDLQMVSAACPSCRILLVEGDNNSLDALSEATKTAARLGASVASHSYGANEFAGASALAPAYQNPAMPSVASSGDWGFTTASFPAVLPRVTAVGGTSLVQDQSRARGWRESAWNGAGSGCSAYFAKPTWQVDTHCSMRVTSDLSAVADPATGVAVYDSYPNPFTDPGWIVLGGTSASAPLVAGMIGAAGSPTTWRPATAYSRTSRFNDVIGGLNGFCGGDYLCKAVPGYDGPTGVGTPRGLAAFTKR